MNNRRERQRLQVQFLETQRMADLIGDDPIMGPSINYKLRELEQQLQQVPNIDFEAKATLTFFGGPVVGSEGIEAQFASRILASFQNMVAAEFTQKESGEPGKRGKLKDESKSKLFITALPRGSFGFELTKLQNTEIFEEKQMADTLREVTTLVEAASQSDTNFLLQLEDVSSRTLPALRDFLRAMDDSHAGVDIQTGGLEVKLSPRRVQEAFERVSNTASNETELTVLGELTGVLLEAMRFEFITADGILISGRIDESVSREEVQLLAKEHLYKSAFATLLKNHVRLPNGTEKDTYVLKGIKAKQ